MAKKTLKEKIDQVKWWAIGLTIVYLIVGAFLVSDYPLNKSIFDPLKTYNLIKDALTLTAYFLAPTAAFILFSDWREEHRDIRNENVILDALPRIKENSNEIKNIVSMVNQEFQENSHEMIEMFSDKVLFHKKEMLKEMDRLENTKENFKDKKFHEKSSDFCQKQYELLASLWRLFDLSNNLDRCKNSPTEHEYMVWATNVTDMAEVDFLGKAEQYLDCFSDQIGELDALANPYRIL